jgi:hypothetical protein
VQTEESEHQKVGARVSVGSRIFDILQRPNRLCAILSPLQWIPMAVFVAADWPVRDADYLHPASAEVNKKWIYTSTALLRFHYILLKYLR